MRHALAVVPPMSKHSRRSSPRRLANQLPASAPAAGPDSTSRIGDAGGVVGATRRHRWRASSAPSRRSPPPDSHFCSSSRYGPITGIVAALHAVVTMRGYSRICGDTSAEMQTGTPSSARRWSATSALVGRVDVGVEQADADRLDLGRPQLRRRAASRSASAGPSDDRPSAATRSAISNVQVAAGSAAPGTRSAGRTCRSGARRGSAACRRSRRW